MLNITKKWNKYLVWIAQHPKHFYKYSMIFLVLSYIITMSYNIINPPQEAFTLKPPILFSKSDKEISNVQVRTQKMGKIVDELKIFRAKRDAGTLTKQDSVRIDYLFNQYELLKNAKK